MRRPVPLCRASLQQLAMALVHRPCDRGEVAEWLKAPHSKCGIRATVSGVRIPPSPPSSRRKPRQRPQRRQIFSLFQRGLAGPSEPQRLARGRNAVSERLWSLTERTSPLPVRSRKAYPFQSLDRCWPPTRFQRFRRRAGLQRQLEVGGMLRTSSIGDASFVNAGYPNPAWFRSSQQQLRPKERSVLCRRGLLVLGRQVGGDC